MNHKTVFISGHFSIIHPGHLRLFRLAKTLGGRLVVGVLEDALVDADFYVGEQLRTENVRAVSDVDEVILVRGSLIRAIEQLKPDYVLKGREYETAFNPEAEVVEANGGELVFGSGEMSFSASDILGAELSKNANCFNLAKPSDFDRSHGISVDRKEEILDKFVTLKVCVLGDSIVDEYITCDALGMSQEDPTVVVTPTSRDRFIGGAAIVAAHAASLGADVSFFSVVGRDNAGSFLQESLENLGVKASLIEDILRPTTTKTRYRCKGKTLLRVSELHQEDVPKAVEKKILEGIKSIIQQFDLIVFSDFNYGALPQTLVDDVISIANQQGIVVAADSQSSSQVGNICRFKNVTLITPTEFEARSGLRNRTAGLPIIANELLRSVGASFVFVTMAESGFLVAECRDEFKSPLLDKIPALNNWAKDVSGAGDSLLVAAAMAIATGATIWEAASLGAVAAAIQVDSVGNSPLSVSQIKDCL